VAHELRSPVAALVALAEAAPAVDGAPERRRIVALAVAAGRDVERILTDAELRSLRAERVDLGALASGLSTDLIEVNAEEGLLVEGDPTRLRQALANLVSNGLRHGSRIAIDVRALDGRVVVDVADDGPGIPDDVRNHAMEPFFTTKETGRGTGLGLDTARRIVEERHTGTLGFDTGPDGTTFHVWLPLEGTAR
jgi:signal transduction histidine kinase